MKRYPFVIAGTAGALVGILSFHSHGVHALLNASTVAPRKSGTPPQTASPPTTTSPGAPTTSTTTSTSPSTSPVIATGTMENYGYGQLSVQVTVSSSKITDLRVVGLQTAETYSQQIAQQVIPYLRRQVLATQNAHINGLSGATYTSEAYALSVQSALDKLHFG